ncbi:hypothetical protein ACELLULO517_26865 [Acidisoma cellulosilytica]|uniref:Uncharacterized protein n=1 Tax=Acidisoma cellulosilyticum TaxID=2802395 RepID=A0A963Z6U8_9PROT|nr:hypothetical protein [Acidisoma cellulosilyticum]MCB8883897.1 hypothetical protein [Acidisoma cellulosilyticum]
MKQPVSLPPASPAPTFTTGERALIRQAFGLHFGQYPRVADGIFLRVWRGGLEAGQPKLPPAVKSMVERQLLEIRPMAPWPRAFFTKSGLAALRALAADSRHLDPKAYGHIAREMAEGGEG